MNRQTKDERNMSSPHIKFNKMTTKCSSFPGPVSLRSQIDKALCESDRGKRMELLSISIENFQSVLLSHLKSCIDECSIREGIITFTRNPCPHIIISKIAGPRTKTLSSDSDPSFSKSSRKTVSCNSFLMPRFHCCNHIRPAILQTLAWNLSYRLSV